MPKIFQYVTAQVASVFRLKTAISIASITSDAKAGEGLLSQHRNFGLAIAPLLLYGCTYHAG